MTGLQAEIEGKKAELEEFMRSSIRELVAQGYSLDEVGLEIFFSVCFSSLF